MINFKSLLIRTLPIIVALTVSSCDRTTEDVPVTKVEWAADIKAGKTVDTKQAPFSVADKVTVTPDNATSKSVEFDSSNKNVATIGNDGLITVIGAGTSNIKATAGGKTDLFLLTVNQAEPDPVAVSKVEWAAGLKEGKQVEEGSEPFDVSAMVTVFPFDATDKNLTYDSSVETVATISEAGTITIVGQGTTVISATAHNGQKDEFTLEVIERSFIDVESVAWTAELKGGYVIDMTETPDVSAKTTVLPNDATNPAVTYDSSDKTVATISETGVITPLKVGATEIKATAGEKEDTFTLTVISQKRTAVAFDDYLTSASITVPVGATNRIWGHINVTPSPTDLKDKNIVFTSDKENIAIVDQYGVVIGKSAGTAKITVAAIGNANVKAVLDVTVVNATYYPRNAAEEAATPWSLATSPAPNNGTTLTGAFDGIWSTTNGQNTDPMANALSFSAGTNHGSMGTTPIVMTVDMKESKVVNVFKIIHRSGPDWNNIVRFFGFDEIAGSNNGEDFTPIVTMVEVVDAMSPLACAISETTFANDIPYQYIRFTASTKELCATHGLRTDGNYNNTESFYTYPGVRQLLDADRNPVSGSFIRMPEDYRGGSLQLQELYLGKY